MKRTNQIRIDEGATVFKFNNRPTWYVDISLKGYRQRFSLGTIHKTEAMQRAREKLRKYQSDILRINVKLKISFEETLNEYIADYSEVRHTPSTTKLNKEIIDSFMEWVLSRTSNKTLQLDQINSNVIEGYVKYMLSKGNSKATVNRDLRVLKAFFSFALKRRYVEFNPVKEVEFLKEESKLPVTLSVSEIERLLEEALRPTPLVGPGGKGNGRVKERDKSLFNVICFILNTGARFGEAIYLKTADVDFESRTVWFRSKPEYSLKDKQERKIYMNDEVHRILLEQCEKHPDSEWVFPDRNDKPFNESSIHNSLKRVAKRAGIPHANFQILRRTFATINSQKATSFVLKYMMGHSSIKTTEKFYIGGNRGEFTPIAVKYGKGV